MNTAPNSPFQTVFGKVGLPRVYEAQFLTPVDAPFQIMMQGKMNRVWHKPNWLTPLFGVLSWFDILFPETGTNIPARMDIIGGRDKQGRPFQRWNRGFTFPQVFRRFNAIMTYDDDRKSVIEVMGPAGVIQIEWKVAFEPPDTIRIETSQCYLVIGSLKLRLPALLHPSVVAIETTHGDMTMHVDLRVSHIFFGEVFGYDGTFTVQQTEIITSSDDSPVAT